MTGLKKTAVLLAVLILVLLVCCVFIFFPLFAGGKGDVSVDSNGIKTITLKIAHNMDFVTIPNAVVEAGNRLNARYEKEGKNIRLAFETDYQTIDWTEYSKNIIFSHKSGDAPDIFTADADIAALVRAGIVLDISSLATDAFVPNAWASSTVNGKQYAMPFDMPLRVIYYSKESLRKIGWSDAQIKALPEQIRTGAFTFNQFMALCAEVVAKGGSKYGLVHRPGAGSDFLDVLTVLGGQVFDGKGKLVFDDAAITRFFEFTWNNANVAKITPPNLNQLGWDTINRMVATGEAFAYYGPVYSSVYVAGAIKSTPAQLAETEEFVLFPVSDYNKKPFAVAAPQCVAISAQTKYPEICKELLNELVTNSTDLLAKHAATIFSLSSVKKANEDPQVKTQPVLSKVLYMADYAIPYVSIPGSNQFRTELFKQIVTLELGQTKPAESLEAFKKQMQLNVNPQDILFK